MENKEGLIGDGRFHLAPGHGDRGGLMRSVAQRWPVMKRTSLQTAEQGSIFCYPANVSQELATHPWGP